MVEASYLSTSQASCRTRPCHQRFDSASARPGLESQRPLFHLKPAAVFEGKIRGMEWRSSRFGFQQPMSGGDGRLLSHAAVCLAPARPPQLGIESMSHLILNFSTAGDISRFGLKRGMISEICPWLLDLAYKPTRESLETHVTVQEVIPLLLPGHHASKITSWHLEL